MLFIITMMFINVTFGAKAPTLTANYKVGGLTIKPEFRIDDSSQWRNFMLEKASSITMEMMLMVKDIKDALKSFCFCSWCCIMGLTDVPDGDSDGFKHSNIN